jgi:hypothetical protein
MAGSEQDDGGFQSMPTRKTTTKKSLYIGNLPVDIENLEEKLVELLKKSKPGIVIEQQDVTVVRSKGCHAVVACPGNLDELIQKLHRTEFEGNRIAVQRERKQKTFAESKNPVKSKVMGKPKQWANGKKPVIATSWAAPTQIVEEQVVEAPAPATIAPVDIQEVSERIGAIVGDEMENARKNGQDELNSLIASTAAVSMLAFTGFGLPEGTDLTPEEDNKDQEDTDVGGFMARCQQPMSSLMGEYGDHDPNWKQVEPEIATETATTIPETPVDASVASVATPVPEKARVLGMQGKMPVHVEFTSFGYKQGAPAQARNGWTYSQPLPVFDCRSLPAVPQYLERQDGLSGAVKRALMYNPHKDDPSKPSMKSFAKEVADEVAPTMIEAINEGGYGYAMPLRMVIHIGSESGRHRAVVAAELAATALRKILRANKDTQFKQPCSVGTRHSQVARRRREKVKVGKQNALEGE